MKYKLAIFDMDGTILNTLDDLADSTNAVLRAHGYPEHSIDEIRKFVGNGIRKLIERAVPAGLLVEEIDQVHQEFMEYYQKHCADKTKPYEGVTDLLQALLEEGVQTAVLSNKADVAVQELCQDYFSGLFHIAVGERPGMNRKPSPDGVEYILDQLQIDKKDAVYIGDSEVDVQTAANAGLDSIIVLWGFRDRALLESYGAARFAEKAEDCLQWMR